MKRWIVILMAIILPTVAWAGAATMVPSDEVRFAIFSDPHLYDRRLGTTGSAFEEYLSEDRKLIRESEAILEAAVNELLEEDVDFVLVPGDLTKDGELISHILFQQYIQILEDHGIPVFTICGNHDINNTDAFAYKGDITIPVKNATPLAFRIIHWENAYARAIYADWNSLSYVVEPAEDLWIVAIDSCKYRNQGDDPETGGAISRLTLLWLEDVMQDAATQGKTVFAFLHHGVLEHYRTQSLIFGDYVIDDWRKVSKQLADMGLRVVFTGHFHAQDIVKKSWEQVEGSSTFLFDIETGSLVTAPVPYRLATFNPQLQTLQVESRHITEIDYDTGGVPFPEYASNYLYEGLLAISRDMLTDMFGLSEEDAETIAPFATKAFMAHYEGDEQIDPESSLKILELLTDEDPLMNLLGLELLFLWKDLAPADNTVAIDLTTGNFGKHTLDFQH